MHRYNLLIAGLFMVGVGAYLIFANPQTLPLWFVWLAGPLLWYVGIALSISGVAVVLFKPLPEPQQVLVKKQKARPMIPVLHLQRFAVRAPSGLTREIPAMGGFII